MVRVDVLIPHYNDVEGLKLSINSVLNQTWAGIFRIVICDDGSGFEKKIELKNYLAELNSVSRHNVCLIENLENLGRPKTRNVLLNAIESEYVSWLDAGDEWYPNKIKKQFNSIYRSEFKYPGKDVWVTCDYDWQWVGRRRRKRIQKVDSDQLKELLVGQNLRSYLWTILASAEAFKNNGYFDESLPRLQDLDYFIRFVANDGILVKPDRNPLCVYHKSDIGRDAEEIKDCYFHIHNKNRYIYQKFSKGFQRNRVYDVYMHTARFAINNNDKVLSYKFIFISALISPLRFIYGVIVNKGIKL